MQLVEQLPLPAIKAQNSRQVPIVVVTLVRHGVLIVAGRSGMF